MNAMDQRQESLIAGSNPRFGQRAARISATEMLSLWQQYKRTGDRRVRDRLIFTFTPMVRYIVYRKVREVPAQCDVEDFLSCGLEALIHSIERYDPAKGATLEQFAWTRIHGAVLDELRRHDWAPRSLRRAERTINGARESFASQHERHPSREELAAAAGMNPAELSRRLDELALAEVGSLNKTIRSEDSSTIERIDTLESEDERADPTISAERMEAKERFRAAFAQLPARERQVAVLLYVEGRTLRDIGARLGVSESRVSQIHTELRGRLRERLAGDASLFSAV
jgi:RNA polymerase sigma factor for flagellar operon FliA